METNPAGQRECSRCDRKLNKINTNPDSLCGYCQSDLASHHPNSRAYIDWCMRGRPREIHRTRSGTPLPMNGPSIAQQVHTLQLANVSTNMLLEELSRRREEAQKTLAIFDTFGRKPDGT